ncbi:MlaD family protein, partial [Flavobacteriales bacterium]|nr:MlaD family protein [Flavobacteriales bacterium]
MKKSSEFFIGLFSCILLVVLYWGVNFLKGENLFSNKRFYYALYENIDGLTISRPVTVNGFKVGQVSNISFQPGIKAYLIVEFAIEESISFSNSSVLEIYDAD